MTVQQSITAESETPSSVPPPASAEPAETQAPSSPSPPPPAPEPETPKDVAEEKSVIPVPPPDKKPGDDSKALVLVDKTHEAADVKPSEGSVNRDAMLAKVAAEKTLSLIKAWKESKKSRAENKAQKMLSAISAWENSEKAALEAELKKIEEQLEKRKAEYAEKIKNKRAEIHRKAEEKRAIVEAIKGKDLVEVEEKAAKFRATGTAPKKLLGKLKSLIVNKNV